MQWVRNVEGVGEYAPRDKTLRNIGGCGTALSNGGWVGQNVDFQRYLLIESPIFLKIFLIFHSMIFLF